MNRPIQPFVGEGLASWSAGLASPPQDPTDCPSYERAAGVRCGEVTMYRFRAESYLLLDAVSVVALGRGRGDARLERVPGQQTIKPRKGRLTC